jgi:radical SAM protein with 4Fe4S-binding SPASM domain
MSAAEQAGIGFQKQTVSFEIFAKVVDEIAAFPRKPKVLMFDGHGEPLTHPRLAEMVRYAKERSAAERVEIVTNGSLLTREMSDALIDAGLDRMRVSLQGCSPAAYERICGVKLDFDEFIDNLHYFYARKVSTDLYVKIIDIALDVPPEEFHALFDGVSDTAAIEHLFPNIQQIDHSKMGGELKYTKEGNEEARRVDVCPMPFYMAVVLPDGNVTGCCKIEPPAIFGNIAKNNLQEIWNGQRRRKFLQTQISERSSNKICQTCQSPDYGIQQGDFLDKYSERMAEIYYS